MKYKHTQVWYVMISAFLIISIITLLIYSTQDKDDLNYSSLYVIIFVLFILTNFFTLTVKVTDKNLKIRFWYWLLWTRKISIEDIEYVKIVKNHWFFWWWIRFWFWPNMKIYNVSWLDAVELTMKCGKFYRIWTDEPEKLKDAIKDVI